MYDDIEFEYDIYEDAISFDSNLTIDVRENQMGSLDDIYIDTINIYGGIDYANNQILVGGDAYYDSVMQFDGAAEILDNVIYIFSQTMETGTIYKELENFDLFSIDLEELNFEEIDYDLDELISEIFDIYIDSIDKDNIEVEDDSINYFGETINVTKTTFIYNENSYNNIISGISNSEIILEYLTEVTDYAKDEIIDILKNGEYADYLENELNVSIYTTGLFGNCVGYSVGENDNIKYFINGDESVLIFERENGEDLEIEFEKKDDVIYYSTSYDELMFISGQISESKCTIKFIYDVLEVEFVYNMDYASEITMAGNLSLNIIQKSNDDNSVILTDLMLNYEYEINVVDSLDSINKNSLTAFDDMEDSELKEYIGYFIDALDNSVYEYIDTNTNGNASSDLSMSDLANSIVVTTQTVVMTDEIANVYNSCYSLSDLVNDGYIANVDLDLYNGKVVIDRETASYYIFLIDLENNLVINNYNYTENGYVTDYYVESPAYNVNDYLYYFSECY